MSVSTNNLFKHLLFVEVCKTQVQIQCCFTFTETIKTTTESIRTVRDGEPRTATSTFTQLLSSGSNSLLLYVHRDHKVY